MEDIDQGADILSLTSANITSVLFSDQQAIRLTGYLG